jgi:hypothetical protein
LNGRFAGRRRRGKWNVAGREHGSLVTFAVPLSYLIWHATGNLAFSRN